MLKSIDILIGFSVVMLMVSMAVTVLTQVYISLSGQRGKHLLVGLTSLLEQLLSPSDKRAGQIAEFVLKHPLIADPNGKLGAVIQRAELIRILLELGAGEGPTASQEVRDAVRTALQNGGIANPENVLKNIRLHSLELEASQPELATHLRQSMAIISQARSDFVAMVAAWFDETMDRVTHTFVYHTRWVTAGLSLLVALGLQFDALGLLRQLSVNDQLRIALVGEAARIREQYEKAPGAALDEQARRELAQLSKLAEAGVVPLPENWLGDWGWGKFPGIILSAMLLSLGAPFWYNALKNLVRLRPLLAMKEEAEREGRQTQQAKAETPAPTSSRSAGGEGERGDLSATGAAG